VNPNNFTSECNISTGYSADLSENIENMKAIKCMLPMIMFLFMGLIGQAQVATKTAEVNTKVKETTCQKVSKTAACKPAACDALVKVGLCTPEQAAKCKKDGKNVKMASTETAAPKATKVAAASKERTGTTPVPKAKGKECAKTCAKTCKKSN